MIRSAEDRPPLPPPRFSLRTLLLAVTLFGVYCGLFWWLPVSAMAGITVVGMLVAAHVCGNAVGTQLRDRASQRQANSAVDRPLDGTLQHAPLTHLGEHYGLGWGMLLPTGVGAIAAIVAGCYWIEHSYHLGFDLPGLAIASLAFGTLGGLAAFALATFTHVLSTAFWQALRHK